MAHILNACIVLAPCGGGGGGHFHLGMHVVYIYIFNASMNKATSASC